MIIRMLNDVLCGRDDLRLPRGGEIDRLAPIPFRFNGVEYQGYRGDTGLGAARQRRPSGRTQL